MFYQVNLLVPQLEGCSQALAERSNLGKGRDVKVLDPRSASLRGSVRHWGWRLRFPANLLTVPAMGRLQWSQIIRMAFSLNLNG